MVVPNNLNLQKRFAARKGYRQKALQLQKKRKIEKLANEKETKKPRLIIFF